jgi:hypothetical protein
MEIFKYLGDMGLQPWMAFVAVLVLGIVFILKDGLVSLVKKFKWKKKGKEFKIGDLTNHDIFNTIQRVKQEVKVMRFFTDGTFDNNKTRMCQDFTNFKCDVCYEGFEHIITLELENMSYNELKTTLLSEMWVMHNKYIIEIKTLWLSKGIPTEDVDYVIELFERFRFDVVQSFQHRIDAIFASSYHSDKFEKILACYDMFAMGIDLLPKDLQTTFEALNGRFKKIKY